MTRHRQALGREGELRAARYLEARGYQIVGRNVRAERVEIDLIARDRRHLVFVEVKTRRESEDGVFGSHRSAAEAVDERKQARLRRGALAWLRREAEARDRRLSMRFDVVTCLRRTVRCRAPSRAQNEDTAPRDEARWSIEHWRGAF